MSLGETFKTSPMAKLTTFFVGGWRVWMSCLVAGFRCCKFVETCTEEFEKNVSFSNPSQTIHSPRTVPSGGTSGALVRGYARGRHQIPSNRLPPPSILSPIFYVFLFSLSSPLSTLHPFETGCSGSTDYGKNHPAFTHSNSREVAEWVQMSGLVVSCRKRTAG